ncbi:hypothetical protein GF312_00475 [Candidatus Poribacteria bacterium]|nr:hypothetical protein [Candidatus Poribacteria bacterium]
MQQKSGLEFVKNQQEKVIPEQTHPEDISLISSTFYRLLQLSDYIAITRPLLLIPVWTMLFLGYYKSIAENLNHKVSLPIIGELSIILKPDKGIITTFILYSLLMGAIYILNQLSDINTDKINGKLYLVYQGYIDKKRLKIQIISMLLVSVTISLLVYTLSYLYLIILSIVIGIMYSVTPFRLKGRPFFDLIANAFGFGIVAFAVGWASRSEMSTDMILSSIPYVICVAAAFINTTIPDIKGDVQNGDITTGAFLGIPKACITSTILLTSVPVISWFLRDFIAMSASIISLPFFIYMTFKNLNEKSPDIKAVILATKISLLTLSIFVAIFMPFYFVLLFITILFIRLYYHSRFGISYP